MYLEILCGGFFVVFNSKLLLEFVVEELIMLEWKVVLILIVEFVLLWFFKIVGLVMKVWMEFYLNIWVVV